MSDLDVRGPASAVPHAPGARRASVTLRQGDEAAGGAEMMDPATRALGDALKTTYRLLQWTMVVLVAVFAFSSFQTVHEGERAVRLVMGKVQASDLGPGLAWSLPYPFGELIKVQTSNPSITLDKEFFPQLSEAGLKQSVEELKKGGEGRATIDPEIDGSLITADGSVVHARWTVKYRRDNPRQVVGTVPIEYEQRIVMGAVRRGAVQAAASLTIDEILKNQPEAWRDLGTARTAEQIALAVAQKTLSDMNCGLVIEQLTLGDKMPPLAVAKDFDKVQAAQSEAGTLIDNAKAERNATLSNAAGPAAEPLIGLIDRYETALALEKRSEAEATQDAIDKILLGEPAVVDGTPVKVQVLGTAASAITTARQERRAVVDRAQRDATTLSAFKSGYQASPTAVIAREWADAMHTFMSRPEIQTLQLGARDMQRLVLTINRDPTLARDQEQLRLLKDAEMRRRERAMRRAEEQFTNPTNPKARTGSE
jgi:regulator of protease activity HflC (stomatin/prohibitin superfamily)